MQKPEFSDSESGKECGGDISASLSKEVDALKEEGSKPPSERKFQVRKYINELTKLFCVSGNLFNDLSGHLVITPYLQRFLIKKYLWVL